MKRDPTSDPKLDVPMQRGVYFSAHRTAGDRLNRRCQGTPSDNRTCRWTRPGKVSVAGLALVLIALVACLPVIMSGSVRGRAAYDSINYHEKAIRQFAQELPTPNLNDYLSATTPGYHLVLAGVGRALGGIGNQDGWSYQTNLTATPPDPKILRQRKLLQVIGLCFTLVMLYTVGHWTERRIAANPFEPLAALAAAFLALPLIASPYVYQSAVWLLPDNSAWLGVLAMLLIALRARPTGRVVVTMGLVLLCLVLMRQIHAWAAGLIWASVWVGACMPAARDGDHGPLLEVRDVIPTHAPRSAFSKLAFALACSIPAGAALFALWLLWGRHLVPPTFIAWHPARIQASASAFILGLIALAAPFFGSWLWRAGVSAWQNHRGSMVLACVVAFALATIPPTAWDMERGRFGGVWSAYKAAGSVGRRSLALAVLAPLGAMVVVAALAGMRARQRWIMLATLCGFAAANSFNPQLWQRYHEPFVLIWLVVAAALCAERQAAPAALGLGRAWKFVGPLMLAILLAITNAVMVLRTEPQTDKGYSPGNIKIPPSYSSTPTEKQPAPDTLAP